jgi:uncharacterized protein DUF5047
MITLSATALGVAKDSHRPYMAIESWRGSTLLAAAVPVDTAVEECDRSLRVPERLTLTVPREVDGVDWSPTSADHPLAANGQTLRVKLGLGLGGTTVEWFQRGVFLIHDSTVDGDTVTVNAVGLLQYLDEARLISPFQPTGTLVSTLRALTEPALTVAVDSALVDRSVPTGINFDEDRLGAVLELLDAWPADAQVDPTGYLRVTPPAQSIVPVLALVSSAGGTIITATGGSSRDGAFNVVVARGTASDGGQVQSQAYDTSGGPKAYGGLFNPLPVPFFYASPLLTTVAQCSAAASTVLARKLRDGAREFTVDMVPHPAIQHGDVVTADGAICMVQGLTLPYTAGGGSMALTLKVVA